MLNFSDVALRRGNRVLFAGATFSLFRGEKVGITGENGSGKSSLLALIRGELAPEAGSFEMPSRLQLAHVSQELDASEQPAIDFVLAGDEDLVRIESAIAAAEARDDGLRLGELHARYAAIGGYDARSRAAQLMHGLGFANADEPRPVRAFSGGWRVRLNLARALMCRSDLLLLDEPTNHLDLDAIIWLEGWLHDYSGTLLLITHDRDFLDRIANRIVNLEHAHAQAYRGNYSAFEEQRAAQLAQQASLLTRQQRQIRHMESFVERFRAKASKARQAQSRLKALERMQRIAPAHVDSAFEFAFAPPEKLPRPLLALEAQSAGYDGQPVLRDINLTVSPGDRIALLGRNGAGKSTYMKLLAGRLEGLSGTRTEARDLRVGYFAQHQLEELSASQSPLDNLRRIEQGLGQRAAEQDLRDFLAGFGFRGDRVFEPVAPFSGGEKARLALALVAFQRPNLLLLDEPTNHLDLEMRQALTVALQDYAGAVVFVSHDRHLLRTVADTFHVVHGGAATVFDGDLDDYARWLNARQAGTGEASAPAAGMRRAGTSAPAAAGVAATGGSHDAAARRSRQRAQDLRLNTLRTGIRQCERDLERLNARRATLQAELAAAAATGYGDAAQQQQLQALGREHAALGQQIEALESRWLTDSEQLELEQATP